VFEDALDVPEVVVSVVGVVARDVLGSLDPPGGVSEDEPVCKRGRDRLDPGVDRMPE
jgi:hypothetical protein